MFPPADAPPPPNPNTQAPLSTNTPSSTDADEQARLAQRKTLTPLSMTPEQTGDLWKMVNRSDDLFKKQSESWKVLLKEYLPTVKKTGEPEDLKVNAHFYNAHQKLPQLFYRSPQIACIAKGPAKTPVQIAPGQQLPINAEDAGVIGTKQAVLNWYLGAENIDGSRLMDECLFDDTVWSGIAGVKVGYRATIKLVQKPVTQPDPNWKPPIGGNVIGINAAAMQPPQVPVMNPDGTPQMKSVPVPIHEDIYARRFSPLKIRFNDDLASSRFDQEATWMGWRFALPKDLAKREFALSEDELSKTGDDEWVFRDDRMSDGKKGAGGLVKGIELWRKAALFRPDEQPHPLALDHIVLIDGIRDYPVVCRPSPDQSFDDEGRLTNDSLIGFPICIVSVRDLADSPFPPADNAFTNAQAKELNVYRRQDVMIRDAAIGKQLYDSSHFEDTELDILKNGDVGAKIGVKPGALSGGSERLIANVAQVTQTQDSWRSQEVIKQDMQQTMGMSGPQVGATMDTVRPATELAQMAAAAATRISKEQDRALACYIAIARKVDQLIMRYGPKNTEIISVVGQDGARDLIAWNRQLVSGRYAYDILPDSSWRLDSTQIMRLILSGYNLMKGDPLFNRAPLMRKFWQMLGYDPKQMVMTPEQIAQMAAQGQSQPQHAQAQADTHEQRRTGDRPNNPQSGQPSRVMA